MTWRNEARGEGNKRAERVRARREEGRKRFIRKRKNERREGRRRGGMTDKRAGIVIAQIKQSANVRFSCSMIAKERDDDFDRSSFVIIVCVWSLFA